MRLIIRGLKFGVQRWPFVRSLEFAPLPPEDAEGSGSDPAAPAGGSAAPVLVLHEFGVDPGVDVKQRAQALSRHLAPQRQIERVPSRIRPSRVLPVRVRQQPGIGSVSVHETHVRAFFDSPLTAVDP